MTKTTELILTIEHDEIVSASVIRDAIADKCNKLPVGGVIKNIHLSLPGTSGLSLDFEF